MECPSSYESASGIVVKLLKDALGGKLLRCSTFKLHQSGASAGGNEGMLIEKNSEANVPTVAGICRSLCLRDGCQGELRLNVYGYK